MTLVWLLEGRIHGIDRRASTPRRGAGLEGPAAATKEEGLPHVEDHATAYLGPRPNHCDGVGDGGGGGEVGSAAASDTGPGRTTVGGAAAGWPAMMSVPQGSRATVGVPSAAKQNTPPSIGGAIAVTAGSTAKHVPVSPGWGAAGSTDSGTCRSTKTSSQLVNGYCALGSTAGGSFLPLAATRTQIADTLSVHW